VVIDFGAEDDDALVKQPGDQLIIERPRHHGLACYCCVHDRPVSGWVPVFSPTMGGRTAAGQGNLRTAEKITGGESRAAGPDSKPSYGRNCAAAMRR
jgi:hypothetical protein